MKKKYTVPALTVTGVTTAGLLCESPKEKLNIDKDGDPIEDGNGGFARRKSIWEED